MPTSPRKSSLALLSGQPSERRFPVSEFRVEEAVSTPQLDPARQLDVYSQEPGYVIAVAGRYLIHLVSERTTSTTISLIRRALADLSDRYETFGYLCVLEQGAPVTLSADLRESVHAFVRRYSTRFSGAAIVFEATGFHATVVRSLVTAVNLASRASHPTKVFDDLRAGTSWLRHLTPGEPTAARLFELTEQLRRAK